jgi:LytS/YehU family sensor histidine kinase
LQPLAENAIRHGLMETSAGGTITLTVKRSGNRVEIHLADDGAGLPPGWNIEDCVGQGLAITRERLAALFPHQPAQFTIEARSGGGTMVRVVIPMLSNGVRR